MQITQWPLAARAAQRVVVVSPSPGASVMYCVLAQGQTNFRGRGCRGRSPLIHVCSNITLSDYILPLEWEFYVMIASIYVFVMLLVVH